VTSIALGGVLWDAEVTQTPAPEKDQDAVVLMPDFVGVADGSTPLAGTPATGVRPFAERALTDLAAASELPTKEMFRAALERAERADSAELGPSCAIALVRTADHGIEADVLGDCLVVALGGGGLQVVDDPRIDAYDAIVARQIADAYKAGQPDPMRLPSVTGQLVEHRRLANRRGTYWMFAGDPAAAEEVRSAGIAEDARAILVATDGFARLAEPLGVVADRRELIERSLRDGLPALVEELRAAEREESSMARAPRLSVHDDASAVLLRRSGY
jgi:hypothetical protein